jgi:hypothetical protein
MHKCGRKPSTVGLGSWCYTTAPLIQYDNSAEIDKVAEKIGMRHFPHFIYKFMKLFMIFYELFPKRPGKIGPVNFSKITMNFLWTVSKTTWKNWACQYFQNYHEMFPKLLGNFDLLNISKKFWKFFQVVLETFHALKMLLGQCTVKYSWKIRN